MTKKSDVTPLEDQDLDSAQGGILKDFLGGMRSVMDATVKAYPRAMDAAKDGFTRSDERDDPVRYGGGGSRSHEGATGMHRR